MAKLVNWVPYALTTYTGSKIARRNGVQFGREQFPAAKDLINDICVISWRPSKALWIGISTGILLNALQEADVDISGISVSDHNSGQAFIQADSDAETPS